MTAGANWVTDSTGDGTRRLVDNNSDGSSNPDTLLKVPDGISLNTTLVAEAADKGTTVGTLRVDGQDGADKVTFALAEPSNIFAISGDKLVVTNGLLPDFEQKESVTVALTAKDAQGATFASTLTVKVGDVTPEHITADGSANTLVGGEGNDRFYDLGGSDKLAGGAGNDLLDGGDEATLTGGTGNDNYVVSTAGDKVVEAKGEGTDEVQVEVGTQSLSQVTLAANVENMEIQQSSGLTFAEGAELLLSSLNAVCTIVEVEGGAATRLGLIEAADCHESAAA